MSQRHPLDAKAIAVTYPHLSEKHLNDVVVPQIQHRIELVKVWDIQPRENILEIGCGQGDCIVTLATAVGDEGHVTAVDPAPLDYGSPYTLGQSQGHLLASPVGSRISFVQAEPVEFLQSTTGSYTTAVIAHCIWYFSSPSVLRDILSALAHRAQRICIAEHALTASDPRSAPHVLAALTQASMECRKPNSTSNIRTVLSPAAIHATALDSGLALARETRIVPVEGLLDGHWEVSAVVADGYVAEIQEYVRADRERAVVLAMRDAVRASWEAMKAKGRKAKTMDTWLGVYTRTTAST